VPEFVAGLVLAAGGSSRLGEPKQLLPFGGATLLDHVLSVSRSCPFDQLVCVIGGRAPEVLDAVDFIGIEVVENQAFGDGCSSSIAAALGAVDERAEVLVLMLGDQPGVRADTVENLLARRDDAPLAVCRYDDGRGHPLAFARSLFGELAQLHGDKAVWKLLDRHSHEVAEVAIHGPAPRDVDTWQDYEELVGSVSRPERPEASSPPTGAVARRWPRSPARGAGSPSR
jgi:molybdenum cofactor cytidylyltransferase